MDVQMQTVSTVNTAATATNAAGKVASTETASKDSFNQVLDGQIGLESAPGEATASDSTISLDMLLQMLQSLVVPVQGTVVQEQGTGEQALPEMLIEAMNSNPALAEQLLQDPKLQKWFENADQLLSTLGDAGSSATFPLTSALNIQQANMLNLKAQNTLLTLAALTKQQPDNPILKFLNEDLAQTIQANLPELMANLKGTDSTAVAANATAAGVTEGLVEGSKNEKKAVDKASHLKHVNKLVEPKLDSESYTIVEPAKSKLEILAIKTAFHASTVEPLQVTEQSSVTLVDLPTDVVETPNSIVTIADLQKAQQAANAVDKAPATIHSANFAEEMTEHVLKNMKITMAEGFSEAKLSLFPKNLGHVDVRISMHDGQLIAQFAADSLAGKQMLESQLPQLRQALLTQGLQVEKLEVTQSQNMQSSMFQDQRQQQTFSQSQRQSTSRSGNYDEESLDFNQEIETVAQIRTALNGNSFDVIA